MYFKLLVDLVIKLRHIWLNLFEHETTSWLDHVIYSSDMQNNVVSIDILEKSPSSDHLALSVTFDIMCKPVTIEKYTCHKV